MHASAARKHKPSGPSGWAGPSRPWPALSGATRRWRWRRMGCACGVSTPAMGSADLIPPQNALTSLELEVAKARPRRAAQKTAQKDAKTPASNAKPAALPSVSKTNAPAHLGTVHVAEEMKGSFEEASPAKPTIGAAQKVAGLGPEE